MKKIIYLSIIFFTNIYVSLAWDLRQSMLPEASTLWIEWEWTSPLDQVISNAKNLTFTFLWLIVVWVFLYYWYLLVTSKWNSEELKKSLFWFLYAVVWLAIIPLAWWVVKVISSLDF